MSEIAHRPQEFCGYPFALPLVEVRWLGVTPEEEADPQLPTFVPDRGESV